MITGFGEAGDWNGQHFRSPSVLDFGEYLLVAFEGWPDDTAAAGIALQIGVERWLRPLEQSITIPDTTMPVEIVLGNYGAGDLQINDISIVGGGFMMVSPDTPQILKSSEELRIPVTSSSPGNQGLVIIESNSQFENPLIIDLNTP